MNTTPDVLDTLARLTEPRDVLAAALDRYGRLPVVSSLGPQTVAIVDLLAAMGRLGEVDVVLLDTGLLFPETDALRRAVEDRYGLTVRAVASDLDLDAQAARHGPALWARDPDACCAIRKLAPLRRLLAGQVAWIAGLRRDQGPSRAQVRTFDHDARHGLVKVSPLAHWSRARLWDHLLWRGVPYNALLDQGYASVGCAPCTQPSDGDDERAGRWAGRAKTECGLHG